jgi:hypothetical protein
MRPLAVCLLSLLLCPSPISAQQNTDSQTVTADCTFEDGKQITMQYTPGKREEPRNGKLWEPGGAPMILFAQAPLTLSASSIAPGAYTVYTIPGRKEWMLIVNKNVTAGSKYDPSQDIARGPMEIGELDKPQEQLQVAFAHMAPKVCSLRLYYGKLGAFADLKEQ